MPQRNPSGRRRRRIPECHIAARSPFIPTAAAPIFLRMTDAVSIRRGVPESLRAQATALYCEALQAKLTPFLGPVERAARFLAPAMREDRAFVAIDDTGILGIAGFQENRTGLFDIGLLSLWREYGLSTPVRAIGLAALDRREVPDTLLMDGIAVAAAARGRGIGTRLLAAACDRARDLGKTGVRLDVVDTNPRAGALYERQGFIAVERTGIGPFRAIFPFRTVTMMRKSV